MSSRIPNERPCKIILTPGPRKQCTLKTVWRVLLRLLRIVAKRTPALIQPKQLLAKPLRCCTRSQKRGEDQILMGSCIGGSFLNALKDDDSKTLIAECIPGRAEHAGLFGPGSLRLLRPRREYVQALGSCARKGHQLQHVPSPAEPTQLPVSRAQAAPPSLQLAHYMSR